MNKGNQLHVDRPIRALAWMIGASLALGAVAFISKLISSRVHPIELVFYRSLINLVVVLPVLPRRLALFLPPGYCLLVLRGIFGFLALMCMYYAVGHLPLSVATLLSWSSPIFVMIFSRIFLKERSTLFSIISTLIAIGGVAMLLHFDSSGTLSPIGILIGFLGAACAGLSFIATRAAVRSNGAAMVVFYFALISCLISLPNAIRSIQDLDTHLCFVIAIFGLLSSFGQLMMTKAYAYAPAPIVSAMSLLIVLFSIILGIVILEERMSLLQWGGIVLILLAIFQVTYFSQVGIARVSEK